MIYSSAIKKFQAVQPVKTVFTQDMIREARNVLLKNSDWTQVPDSPLSPEKKQQWAEYRQALRDLPETADVNNIAWPQQPI